jgi:hypothetical protein
LNALGCHNKVLKSVSDYARYRGVVVDSVRRAVLDGRIKREPDGSINVEQADIDWERNTRKPPRRDPTVDAKAGLKRRATWAKKSAARAVEVVTKAVAAGATEGFETARNPVVTFGTLDSNSLSYADARAYKENLAAKLAEIELQQRQGSVLPRERVAKAVETLFRVHKDAILNIPNRVAAMVFEQTSIACVHSLLESELRASLEELSTALNHIAISVLQRSNPH